jgi:hypothetical protein
MSILFDDIISLNFINLDEMMWEDPADEAPPAPLVGESALVGGNVLCGQGCLIN